MLYQTVTEQDFIRAFDDMYRSENFSREARRALFEYLDDMSDDIGEDIELDPIAICCEWCEYTADELFEQYGDADPVYRYVIDLDERGLFKAHFDKVNPATGGTMSTSYKVTESDFMEGGSLESVDPHDGDDVGLETLPDGARATILDENDDCDALEELIESLSYDGTLIRVEHYGYDDTYLVSEG